MAQFNFRLFLRPTAIGKAIIERLSADGAERQADSRRWIELGYALEQAGFRLDGTTLYLGGRPFAAEQTPAVQVPASAPTAARAPAHQAVAAAAEPVSAGDSLVAASADAASSQAIAPATAPASAATRPVESAPPKPASPVSAAPPPLPQPAADDDEMANNLRGLSA